MDKYLKKKIYGIIIIFFICMFVLPMCFIFFGVVYGKDPGLVDYNEWNEIPSDLRRYIYIYGLAINYSSIQTIGIKTASRGKF